MSAAEIDEALNLACFQAWRSVETFDPARGSLRAWFFVIARNATREILRDRRRARWETRGDELEAMAANDEIPSTPPLLFLQTLRQCIAALPRMQRKIIEADLRTGDVADADELAKKLQTTKNSIYASRSMARKALKQTLLARGYVPGDGRSQALWN